MDFNEIIANFAAKYKVENLVAIDGAAALDIDGSIVTIVAKNEELNFSAEIGDPPAEGAATFANLLLEANMQSGAFFAKAPDPGPYIAVRRLQLSLVDDESFESALESFVNQVETWRRLLADYRPIAKASTERAKEEQPPFGMSGFMKA